ncbi:MAG TPA: NADH-quinone oxidoreductase subunit L [Candidatus Avacidaminococcus intestinavium]|uniref:NADH-quinone oxidoreductase subunit L n=1 Tax=Candidatus Avacidaminococcus intestinavium TaxID=2840684 RepID=A0A9D1MRJ3_9FIRM|nr:NADH-quinone oxidoreductase subunit L [Candidatus Avacidaminococcus intestinavium]
MNLLYTLIVLPLVIAAAIFWSRGTKAVNLLTKYGAILVIMNTIAVLVTYFENGIVLIPSDKLLIDKFLFTIEVLIGVYLLGVGYKKRKYLLSLFVVSQLSLITWLKFSETSAVVLAPTIVFDKLTAIMVFLIGIIGSLICFYAVSYMEQYHLRHQEYLDRRSVFLGLLFIFLAAMFMLVLSNDLLWLYFSWEITTLCSFWLIGYTRTTEAENNSLVALNFNLGGGVAFAAAITILNNKLGVTTLSEILKLDATVILLPVFLLGLAALTKSAQIPFCSWLVGAMVAPTPSSALLHSSTMVKAGVYLLIRLAPLLSVTLVGTVVTTIGCITFMICSLVAITCSDAKKILAYSTLANLGLIVICAGIGTQEAVWAAILLIIFHAISKALLFMAVGTAEGQLGSRDVEDMDILMYVSKRLAIYMTIGIAGMFLAPFGMLISKWAAMKAFIDSDNILAVTVIAYGSAATLFYWTKWMGKLVSSTRGKIPSNSVPVTEEGPIAMQALLIILSCLSFPLISHYVLVPFLTESYGQVAVIPLEISDIIIMLATMSILLLMPIGILPFYKKDKRLITTVYMSGANAGDNLSYYTAGNTPKQFQLTNWYMRNFINVKKLLQTSAVLSASVIGVSLIVIIGGFSR